MARAIGTNLAKGCNLKEDDKALPLYRSYYSTDRYVGVAGVWVLQEDLVDLLAALRHVGPAVQVPHLCASAKKTSG